MKIDKPYIALNSETYISLHSQELSTCRRIGYEFYCEELFVVESKARYSCASDVYFDLGTGIIKENCEFEFYYNRTKIMPSVVDSGQQIILANWPSYKRIVCSFNNDISKEIHSHPYVLLNGSILCNCDIEAESNFLLESLAACDTSNMHLVMYYTVNLAFVNYFDNLVECLNVPFLKNWTTQEQILPTLLESLKLIPAYYKCQKL